MSKQPLDALVTVVSTAVLCVAVCVPALATETAEVQASRITLADMRTAAVLIETALAEGGALTPSEDWIRLAELELLRPPRFYERLRGRDAWGKPFIYWSDGQYYLLVSSGPDRELDVDYLEADPHDRPVRVDPHQVRDDLLLFGSREEHLCRWGLDPEARRRQSMADLRSIGTAIESYAIDHNAYPGPIGAVGTIALVEEDLEPIYIRTLPHLDGWGREFLVYSDGTCYYLVSAGGEGLFDREYPSDCAGDLGSGATTDPAADIIFANGQFVQWPEGTQQ
jgi:hypothetical protein